MYYKATYNNDFRNLTDDELDEVSGGIIPLVIAGVIAIPVGVAAANFVAGFIDGVSGNEKQN